MSVVKVETLAHGLHHLAAGEQNYGNSLVTSPKADSLRSYTGENSSIKITAHKILNLSGQGA